MSYRAVGHESTIWHSQREEEEIRQSVHKVALESAKVICIVCEKALEKWLTVDSRDDPLIKRAHEGAVMGLRAQEIYGLII